MACEYCNGDYYIIDDGGVDLRIDDLGDGHHYLIANVTIRLAGDSMIAYTNERINFCPMCGRNLGDAS